MKLVKICKYSDIYINMDYITEVSKSHKVTGEYFVNILDNHSYKISEEAYNTILAYGKAKV